MYSVIVEAGFCAIHRVRLPDGSFEPPHGHDWRVRAEFRSEKLDEGDMVVDFVAVRAALDEILARMHHTDLNALAPFQERLPTAEVVAEYVHRQLRQVGFGLVHRVEVTEAPGCVAVYMD